MALSSRIKDVMFISMFSTLMFFGAFFLFSSLKKTKVNEQISIKSLEKEMNDKVNEQVQMLQIKNRNFKSKLTKPRPVGIDKVFKEEFLNTNSKYKLDVFKQQGLQPSRVIPKDAFEKISARLELEDLKVAEEKRLLREYKKQIVQKARKLGWVIEVNDDLKVISAKKL